MLLSLGEPLVDTPADWIALFGLAERERLAALAWLRSGSVIRRLAPTDVVARWRAHAMHVALQVETLVTSISSAIAALQRAGIDAVVLKGAPLSERLYGSATARPLADCDLYVRDAHRVAATGILANEGWTSRIGEPPSEEAFERWAGGQRDVIELHSNVLDDPLLWHIRVPVECETVSLLGVSVPAQSGDYLAASLAGHLAKHETGPLLWLFDIFTLWTSLGEPARQAARAAARRVGLLSHLDWACNLADAIPKGAFGDVQSLSALLSLSRPIGDAGRVRRLVRLSANPFDALRVVLGRMWPAEWRDDWRRVPAYLVQRASRRLARQLGLLGSQATPPRATPALAVDDAELATLLNDTLGRGLAIWIRPRGASMEPAIPPSASARIEPVAQRGFRKDDVVLARLPHGHFVLHRVVRVESDSVQLKGDAMRRRDVAVAPNAILGVCDRVEIAGREYAIEKRPRDALALLTSTARARIRRLVSTSDG